MNKGGISQGCWPILAWLWSLKENQQAPLPVHVASLFLETKPYSPSSGFPFSAATGAAVLSFLTHCSWISTWGRTSLGTEENRSWCVREERYAAGIWEMGDPPGGRKMLLSDSNVPFRVSHCLFSPGSRWFSFDLAGLIVAISAPRKGF